jgi:hypothetical protein
MSCLRVVSPPASAHPNLLAARCNPPRNSLSQTPVCEVGKARLNRKQRGTPPIAVTSLIARARHFHPTASGGCLSRRKCEPSRNQSQVRIWSKPAVPLKSAASSPIPRRTTESRVRVRAAISSIRSRTPASPTLGRLAGRCFVFFIAGVEYSSQRSLRGRVYLKERATGLILDVRVRRPVLPDSSDGFSHPVPNTPKYRVDGQRYRI